MSDEGDTWSGLSREGIQALGSSLARRVEAYEALESSQRRARELAHEGPEAAPHGTLVVCGVQTGGRGRHGRLWGSPRGGLWMSMVLRPDLRAGKAARLTQTAAVGVAKALWEFGVEARIKWPNDLLVEPGGREGGRKICGILAESSVENVPVASKRAGASELDERRVDFVVLGVGLNANLEPADLGVEDGGVATVSSELGREVDILELLATILSRLEYELARVADGFEAILDDWRALDCTLGESVRVQSYDRSIEGRAVDLTPEGA
ncbi:MAG: biotin--[acetyl-CoA-carboxylase] ligase, partial [Rubrobacter sp.]|nr:biotin--[acetyl-CoA-carboxylase] ligase [Rubrobacter sp.]